MEFWQEHCICPLRDAPEEKFGAILGILASHFGFEFGSYMMRLAMPPSSSVAIQFSNYPQRWVEQYEEKGLIRVDPAVEYAESTFMPFLWSRELVRKSPEFWEAARAYNLRFGWVHPFHTHHGVTGIMTFSRSNLPLSAGELRVKEREMAWAASLVNEIIVDRFIPDLMPQASIKLTRREIEFLRWTTQGRRSENIAEVMGTSKRNVDAHAVNSIKKMGVSNKTAAAVCATLLGLL